MTNSYLLCRRFLLVSLILLCQFLLPASDHIDGPVTTGHAVADITGLFAFPSPDYPGKLVLIMNVYPGVSKRGHFSDKVSYSFWVRPASIHNDSLHSGFITSGDYKLTCTFETPHGIGKSHWMTCTTSSGRSIRVKVGDINGSDSGDGLRAFAGHRSDPFFFNAGWAVSASKGKIDPPKDENVMLDLNTLSIVVLIDIEQELGLDQGSLFAIAAETTTPEGNSTRRIDWIGRPEITNITMTNNGREEIRDFYNAQEPFNLTGPKVPLFRKRLRDNIVFYDGLNNKKDWTTDTGHQLAEILLNDFLVVDVSKPFSDQTYFEIEYSLFNGLPHKTCGGRVPNEDVVDVIFTMLINAGNKPVVRDGVDRPTQFATSSFPYLATPNKGLAASIRAFVGSAGTKLTTKETFKTGVMTLLSGLFAVLGMILLLYYFIREGIARLGKHKYSDNKHPRLMFTLGLFFGLAGILSFITSASSMLTSGLLIVISVLTFCLFVKWRKQRN